MKLIEERKQWADWLNTYTPEKLFDAIIRNCQGAESRCQFCGDAIYFDIVEGGGVPSWGTEFGDGLDYGCPFSPDTSEDGTGDHLPVGL